MTKQKIITRTKFWQDKFGLQNWDISIYFDKFGVSDDVKFPAIAETNAHPTYLLATISFDKDHLDEVTEHTIIHELLHIILGEIHSYIITSPKELLKNGNHAQNHIEKTISVIERIISRLIKI